MENASTVDLLLPDEEKKLPVDEEEDGGVKRNHIANRESSMRCSANTPCRLQHC